MKLLKRLTESLLGSILSIAQGGKKKSKKSGKKASSQKTTARKKAAARSSRVSTAKETVKDKKSKKNVLKLKRRALRLSAVRGSQKKKKRADDYQCIGEVTHYFPKVKAAVVLIQEGELRIMDAVWIKGVTTDFKQSVASLQINRKEIQIAVRGDEIGMQVKKRVRAGDKVYKHSTPKI